MSIIGAKTGNGISVDYVFCICIALFILMYTVFLLFELFSIHYVNCEH